MDQPANDARLCLHALSIKAVQAGWYTEVGQPVDRFTGEDVARKFAQQSADSLSQERFSQLLKFLERPRTPATSIEQLTTQIDSAVEEFHSQEIALSNLTKDHLARPAGIPNADVGLVLHLETKNDNFGDLFHPDSATIQLLLSKGIDPNAIFAMDWHWRGETKLDFSKRRTCQFHKYGSDVRNFHNAFSKKLLEMLPARFIVVSSSCVRKEIERYLPSAMKLKVDNLEFDLEFRSNELYRIFLYLPHPTAGFFTNESTRKSLAENLDAGWNFVLWLMGKSPSLDIFRQEYTQFGPDRQIRCTPWIELRMHQRLEKEEERTLHISEYNPAFRHWAEHYLGTDIDATASEESLAELVSRKMSIRLRAGQLAGRLRTKDGTYLTPENRKRKREEESELAKQIRTEEKIERQEERKYKKPKSTHQRMQLERKRAELEAKRQELKQMQQERELAEQKSELGEQLRAEEVRKFQEDLEREFREQQHKSKEQILEEKQKAAKEEKRRRAEEKEKKREQMLLNMTQNASEEKKQETEGKVTDQREESENKVKEKENCQDRSNLVLHSIQGTQVNVTSRGAVRVPRDSPLKDLSIRITDAQAHKILELREGMPRISLTLDLLQLSLGNQVVYSRPLQNVPPRKHADSWIAQIAYETRLLRKPLLLESPAPKTMPPTASFVEFAFKGQIRPIKRGRYDLHGMKFNSPDVGVGSVFLRAELVAKGEEHPNRLCPETPQGDSGRRLAIKAKFTTQTGVVERWDTLTGVGNVAKVNTLADQLDGQDRSWIATQPRRYLHNYEGKRHWYSESTM